MNNYITSQDIGLALQACGLNPFIEELNCYGIHRGGDDYEVNTGSLPETYIRKTVSQDLFDWRDDKGILACATNLFNAQPFPVRAVIGYDTMAFVLNVEVVSYEHILERIPHWLDLVEQAIDQFGHACATVVRDWERKELANMEQELSNPSQDSPWLKGKTAS